MDQSVWAIVSILLDCEELDRQWQRSTRVSSGDTKTLRAHHPPSTHSNAFSWRPEQRLGGQLRPNARTWISGWSVTEDHDVRAKWATRNSCWASPSSEQCRVKQSANSGQIDRTSKNCQRFDTQATIEGIARWGGRGLCPIGLGVSSA